MTISNSTISGNTATNNHGGGLYINNYASTNLTRLTNLTISNNRSTNDGGGIYLNSDGMLANTIFEHSTVTSNLADSDSNDFGQGGGIALGAGLRATFNHMILANNTNNNASQ